MSTIVIKTKKNEILEKILETLIEHPSTDVWGLRLSRLKEEVYGRVTKSMTHTLQRYAKSTETSVTYTPNHRRKGNKYMIQIEHGDDWIHFEWEEGWVIKTSGKAKFRSTILKIVVGIDPLALHGIYDSIDYFPLDEVLMKIKSTQEYMSQKK